jgi:hypothetical protein
MSLNFCQVQSLRAVWGNSAVVLATARAVLCVWIQSPKPRGPAPHRHNLVRFWTVERENGYQDTQSDVLLSKLSDHEDQHHMSPSWSGFGTVEKNNHKQGIVCIASEF